jgi:hypothetical protein
MPILSGFVCSLNELDEFRAVTVHISTITIYFYILPV